MDANILFCNGVLRAARADIKKAGIKVGALTTWRDTDGRNPYYEVFETHRVDGRKHSRTVWSGGAYCASEAKYKYLLGLLPENDDCADLDQAFGHLA